MITGYYYLHTNGDLIYKVDHDYLVADFRESDFVQTFWEIDPEDRETAWTVLVESLALGANKSKVLELANKWQCNNEDADVYAERTNIILQLDDSNWMASTSDFVNLQESIAGFGETKLEAMADLAKNLGLKPGKMWNAHLKDLTSPPKNNE